MQRFGAELRGSDCNQKKDKNVLILNQLKTFLTAQCPFLLVSFLDKRF